jgi:hypothetical protein
MIILCYDFAVPTYPGGLIHLQFATLLGVLGYVQDMQHKQLPRFVVHLA